MFSNPNIDVFLRIVPVEMLIFDEASQIESGDYLPILQRFQPTLSKLVFIGDDKQRKLFHPALTRCPVNFLLSTTLWSGRHPRTAQHLRVFASSETSIVLEHAMYAVHRDSLKISH
jgi:hypothetical protein